jgi:hypothetical protein
VCPRERFIGSTCIPCPKLTYNVCSSFHQAENSSPAIQRALLDDAKIMDFTSARRRQKSVRFFMQMMRTAMVNDQSRMQPSGAQLFE